MDVKNQIAINKKFAEDIHEIRSRIEATDLEVKDLQSPLSDNQVLNRYCILIDFICKAFSASSLNIFIQEETDPLILDGVISVRNDMGLTLQFIKNPIDNFTIAGYSFLHGKTINIADLYIENEKYNTLRPSRNKEIDRRLNTITKECLSTPLIIVNERKITGALVLVNYLEGDQFPEIYVRGINALAVLIINSFINGGVFFQSVNLTKSLGKKGFKSNLDPDSDIIDDLENNNLINDNVELDKKSSISENEVNEELNEDLEFKSEDQLDEGDDVDDEELDEEEYELEHQDDIGEEEDDLEGDLEFSEVETESTITSSQPEIESSIKSNLIPVPDLSEVSGLKGKYDYLVTTETISQEDLELAIQESQEKKIPIEEYLQNEKNVSTKEIGISIAAFFNYDYLPFTNDINLPNISLLKLKKGFLENSKWVPIYIDHDQSIPAIVLSTDPYHSEAYGSISQLLDFRQIKFLVTTEQEFYSFLDLLFTQEIRVQDLISDFDSSNVDEVEDDSLISTESDDEIVKLVNKIISDGYKRRSSDIHIEPNPGTAATVVRFRIDGELVEYVQLSASVRSRIINRVKIMANMDISESRYPQDGKINMARYVKNLNIELRVATYPVVGGITGQNLEDVVLRILDTGEPIPLEKLGFDSIQEEKILKIAEKPYGIIFVCGPTGSGKTTTLHSILKHINKQGTKIITAEDPVEIVQKGLRQMQINRAVGLTFAEAVRSFLRSDPDVIMVGEMRDNETVSAGIEASLTGHLVLSTLHTNSAPEAITRLLEMGMDALNFADAILGIVAQRLAKKLCPNCKEKYSPSSEELTDIFNDYFEKLAKNDDYIKEPEAFKKKTIDKIIEEYGEDGKLYLYKPVGCKSCIEGYKGRIGIYELLIGTDRIKQAILKRALVEEIIKIALDEGMYTLYMDGIHKCFQGLTDIKQVKLVCI